MSVMKDFLTLKVLNFCKFTSKWGASDGSLTVTVA